MFNKSSFCHIASNNRNEQKGSVFIYKTTDTLAQVTQSGYFNEKLIDINVHDLIIHVQYDPVARTLKKSVLIVTERTLDNVETTPIIDQTIVENIDQLGGQVAGIEEKIPENASAQNQLATKSEIPTVPTNISAFNNDSGYITSSALTPYATTQELNDGLATKQPAGDYATNSALTSGLALKVAIAQGAENAGKILKIDDSGNVIVADESGGASLPLLTPMWFDHIANDVSWLRADTFSWQSGDVYTAAYEHLVDDFENAQTSTYYAWTGEGFIAGTQETVYTTSQVPSVGDTVYYYGSDGLFLRYGTVATASSANITFTYADNGATSSSMAYGGKTLLPVHLETIGEITIAYRLAQDGHKITTHETDAVAIYEATGVAWYYILDTTNRQFKLPRTKWGFTGLRDSVGGYVTPGLPNITGSFSTASDKNLESGAFSWTTDKYSTNGGGDGGQWGINFSAKKSNSIYGNSTTVQPPATQMYLYFYVGNFEQSAIEQTAGITAETLNGKADSDLGNIPSNYDYVIESQFPTASNGYTWYRKYKSGWVEQGGIVFPTTTTLTRVSITLPVIMSSNVYSVQVTGGDNVGDAGVFSYYTNRTTTGFEILYSHTTTSDTIGDSWQVNGMSAQ